MKWRSKSLLQLVLIGLLTVMAPLCMAIFYTLQTLAIVAQESVTLSEAVVSVTRITQVVQSGLLDLERRARQYSTLEDESLLTLFRQERRRLLIQLDDLERQNSLEIPANSPVQQTRQRLTDILMSLPEEGAKLRRSVDRFARLSAANTRFQQASQAYVDQRLVAYRDNAEAIGKSLTLLVSALVLLTVALSVIFIRWIGRPIRQLESAINQLGRRGQNRVIRISGPREMQALAKQLEGLRERLNAAESRKQQFLMNMSHELKTPLASMREGADLLADGIAGPVDKRQREIIEILQANSHELQRLIENLLDYNRAEHSPGRGVLGPVSLRHLCDELLHSYNISIRRKRLAVYLKLPEAHWICDASRLRTVIDNLLSNAVNYTPSDGRVAVCCHLQEQHMVFEVANTGRPIPESERSQLFDPFFRGSNHRTGPVKGSGIGLNVARDCVQDMGGSLELVDSQDYTICFRMTLPRMEPVIV
ncbi:MAG: ATP-binding protein [Parahaliea sp.]